MKSLSLATTWNSDSFSCNLRFTFQYLIIYLYIFWILISYIFKAGNFDGAGRWVVVVEEGRGEIHSNDKYDKIQIDIWNYPHQLDRLLINYSQKWQKTNGDFLINKIIWWNFMQINERMKNWVRIYYNLIEN